MCSISVEPMPSTIRMPVFSNQASETAAGSGSPAETHVCSDVGDVLAQQRAVGGRRGEQRRDAVPADRVEQVAGAGHRRRRGAEAQREEHEPAEAERERQRRRAAEHVAPGAGEDLARERVAARQQVAVEVHATLRRAGRAGREGDDRDVVGGGVDGLEASRAPAGPRARARAGRRPRPPDRRATSACETRAFSTTFAISPARSSGIVATTIPPASRIPSHAAIASGVFGRVQQHARARLDRERRGDRRRALAQLLVAPARRRSRRPRARSSSTAAFSRAGPSSSSRSGQASAAGRWSRANVSVIAAAPGR